LKAIGVPYEIRTPTGRGYRREREAINGNSKKLGGVDTISFLFEPEFANKNAPIDWVGFWLFQKESLPCRRARVAYFCLQLPDCTFDYSLHSGTTSNLTDRVWTWQDLFAN